MATSDIGKGAFLNVKNKDTGEIEKKTLIPPAPSDGDLGGISEEELAQITTNKEKISSLNEELIDGRTDVDGEVHKNIGDAMRGQARKLRENLVVRQKDQPTDPNNNVWISDEDDEVEVPDMGEFNSLKEDLGNKNLAELHDISFEENMIDLSAITDGYITETGTYQYEASWQYINKSVSVKPSTRYYRLVNSVYEQIVLYDIKKHFIGIIALFANNGTGKDGYFDTPENCYFIEFQATKVGCNYAEQVYSQIKPTKYVKSNTKAKITVPYNVYTENIKEPKTDIVCWGDSLTEGTNEQTPWTDTLKKLVSSKYNVINKGVGNQKAEQIAIRQGAYSVYLKPCTLPNTAFEDVEVECVNENGTPIKFILDSVLFNENVEGAISIHNNKQVAYLFESNKGFTINRNFFLKTLDFEKYRNTTMVIWCGSNNAPTSTTIKDVISVIKNMINYNMNNNYIIIGLTSLTAIPELKQCNEELRKNFEYHFLDIGYYLRTYGLEDAKITPTSVDIEDISKGDIPSSLRVDNVHLTSKANEIVGNQIYKKGKNLGYW